MPGMLREVLTEPFLLPEIKYKRNVGGRIITENKRRVLGIQVSINLEVQ